MFSRQMWDYFLCLVTCMFQIVRLMIQNSRLYLLDRSTERLIIVFDNRDNRFSVLMTSSSWSFWTAFAILIEDYVWQIARRTQFNYDVWPRSNLIDLVNNQNSCVRKNGFFFFFFNSFREKYKSSIKLILNLSLRSIDLQAGCWHDSVLSIALPSRFASEFSWFFFLLIVSR